MNKWFDLRSEKKHLRFGFGLQLRAITLMKTISVNCSETGSGRRSTRVKTTTLDRRVAAMIIFIKDGYSAIDGWIVRENVFESRDQLILSPFSKFLSAVEGQ